LSKIGSFKSGGRIRAAIHHSQTILTQGQGESLVAERIEDWENSLPDFLKLAYLPAIGRVRLRLSARGKDKAFLEKELKGYVDSLAEIINDSRF
jgi:nicotinamide-nucleotide amidase